MIQQSLEPKSAVHESQAPFVLQAAPVLLTQQMCSIQSGPLISCVAKIPVLSQIVTYFQFIFAYILALK